MQTYYMIHDNLLLSNMNTISLLHMDFLDKMVFFHFVVLSLEVHQIILMLMLDKIYILLHFDILHLKDELFLHLLLLLNRMLTLPEQRLLMK